MKMITQLNGKMLFTFLSIVDEMIGKTIIIFRDMYHRYASLNVCEMH